LAESLDRGLLADPERLPDGLPALASSAGLGDRRSLEGPERGGEPLEGGEPLDRVGRRCDGRNERWQRGLSVVNVGSHEVDGAGLAITGNRCHWVVPAAVSAGSSVMVQP
jgi:hypothetical protein